MFRPLLRSFSDLNHTLITSSSTWRSTKSMQPTHQFQRIQKSYHWATKSTYPLKTAEDIEAAFQYFNDTIQWVCWNTTPEQTNTLKTNECPLLIKQKVLGKRRLRRRWHQLRTSRNKRLLNTRELKQLLNNINHNIETFLQALTPTASTDYLLSKAIKTKQITKSPLLLTAQGKWAVWHWKDKHFCRTSGKRVPIPPLRNFPCRRGSTYPLPRKPLLTRPSPQPSPAIRSSCRCQKS
jgi:hypothetical protein